MGNTSFLMCFLISLILLFIVCPASIASILEEGNGDEKNDEQQVNPVISDELIHEQYPHLFLKSEIIPPDTF
jgi:hypothetical protein